jgi:hypothetical protein
VEGTLPNSSQTRSSAADQAGLSEHQRKTALRLAAISERDFNDAVEGDNPPTVTALAAQGIQRRPRRSPPSDVVTDEVHFVVEFSYPRQSSLPEIAMERQLAVLMHAWRRAGEEARGRFLEALGLAVASPR